MASTLASLRSLVATALSSARDSGSYVLNDWEIAEAYKPEGIREELPPGGKVWVVGLASDDSPLLSRSKATQREIPVQIAFQKAVTDTQDVDALDVLTELEEQLRATVKGITSDDFLWLRTEALKDENGTPFSYLGLHSGDLWEAYFTAFFKTYLD